MASELSGSTNNSSEKTPISVLQEQCGLLGKTPDYKLVTVEGTVHAPVFTYSVQVGDESATATGQSKKKAKHAAAKAMIKVLTEKGVMKEAEKRKEEQLKKSKEQKEKKLKAKEELDGAIKDGKAEITKGCVLKLTGLPDNLKWKRLKTFFNKFSPVAYADLQKGQTEATMRFAEEGGAKLALEKALASNEEKKLIINEKEISARIVDGEEEKLFWKEFLELRAKNRQRFAFKGKKGKRKSNDSENKNPESRKKEEGAVITDGAAQKKAKTEKS